MSVNSSFADAPLLPTSSFFSLLECFNFRKSMLILTAFSITNILLILPLSTFILYLGYQRWRQQRNTSTAAAATNNSDVFTYQMVVMEMFAVLGCVLCGVGVNNNLPNVSAYGFYIFFSAWCVKLHFHTLTCMERYLAVVHPIIFLRLKKKRDVRLRNISIGCIWMLCFVFAILMSQVYFSLIVSIYFFLMLCALLIICFCCISVLCALKRPGPGELSKDREQVDQIKRRAFNTLVTIMGTLWLCLAGILVCGTLLESQMLSLSEKCAVRASIPWWSLPSGLVLPLQYLYRAGKLPGCKHSETNM